MADALAPVSQASIQQQAEFLEYLMARCATRAGAVAAEAYLFLEPKDVSELEALAARLRRMAPYENDIRRLVTRR